MASTPVSKGGDSAAMWVDDALCKRCSRCQVSFTVLRRRHHCRACGEVCCGACSPYQLMVDGYSSPQRVCKVCVEMLRDKSENTQSTPEHQKLVQALLKASNEVQKASSAWEFSLMTRPAIADGVTICVDFLSDDAWTRTMGAMLEVGSIPAANATIPLPQVRKLLAQTAVQQFASSRSNDWVNFPEKGGRKNNNTTNGSSRVDVYHQDEYSYHPTLHISSSHASVASALNTPAHTLGVVAAQSSQQSISSKVNGVLQETSAVLLSDKSSVEFGRFVGTMVLGTVGNDALKANLMSSCLTQLFDDETSKEYPDYVIGRSGRIDTGVKAQQLVRLATTAVTQLRSGSNAFFRNPQPHRRRAFVETKTRMRFCSLLNALAVTQKELGFFKNQLAWLSGVNSCDDDRECNEVNTTKQARNQSTAVPIPLTTSLSSAVCRSESATPGSILPQQLYPDVQTRVRKGRSILSEELASTYPPKEREEEESYYELGSDSFPKTTPSLVVFNDYFEKENDNTTTAPVASTQIIEASHSLAASIRQEDYFETSDRTRQQTIPQSASVQDMPMQSFEDFSHTDVELGIEDDPLAGSMQKCPETLSQLQTMCGRREDIEDEEDEKVLFFEGCDTERRGGTPDSDNVQSPISESSYAVTFTDSVPVSPQHIVTSVPSDFEFPTAMQQIGVEYSVLNYIANWPLSLRMGASQPSRDHNATHPLAYQQYVKWLSEEVWNALSDAGCEVLMQSGAGSNGVCESADTARPSSSFGKRMTPKGSLSSPGLRPVSPSMCPSTTPHFIPRSCFADVKSDLQILINEASSEEEKRRASELFMAQQLLQELMECKGSNFRRRAAELLQLCVLEMLLKVVPFFNCKSGVDRTGVCAALWTSVYQTLHEVSPTSEFFCPQESANQNGFFGFAEVEETAEEKGATVPMWLMYTLAMNYPLVLKTVKGIHGCGANDATGARTVPVRQLASGYFAEALLLPFAAGGSTDEDELLMYSAVEELTQIISSSAVSHVSLGSVESRAFGLLKKLFFSSKDAVVPKLQHAFFVNVVGTGCKIAAASTGVHGLKYGDALFGGYNALAAQFLPSLARMPTPSDANADPEPPLPLTENRRGLSGTDVVVSKAFSSYIVAAASARGT